MNISIFRDIKNYAPVKIFAVIISVISFKLSMSVFEKHEYGTISLFVSAATLINTVFFSWIGYVLIRYFEKYKKVGLLGLFLSTFYRIGLWLFFLVTLIFAIYLVIFNDHSNQLRIAILAYLPSMIIVSFLPTIFQLQGDVKQFNIFGLISGISTLAFFSLFVFVFKLRAEAFFLSYIPIGVYGFIKFTKFLKKHEINYDFQDNKIFKEGLRYGLPQIGTALGVLLLSVADRFIIEYYLGTSAVGLYSAAYRFGEMLILLPTGVLAAVFAPSIFKIFEVHGIERAKTVIFKYVFFFSLVFGTISIFCSLNPEVALVLLGSNFTESIAIIPYIIIGVFLFSLCQFTGLFLQIQNKPLTIAISIFIAAICNLLLCFLLIPPFGIIGSAAATLLSYFIYFVIINVQSFKSLNWKFPVWPFLNIFIGLTVAFLCVYFIDLSGVRNIFLLYFIKILILLIIVGLYFFITQRRFVLEITLEKNTNQ